MACTIQTLGETAANATVILDDYTTDDLGSVAVNATVMQPTYASDTLGDITAATDILVGTVEDCESELAARCDSNTPWSVYFDLTGHSDIVDDCGGNIGPTMGGYCAINGFDPCTGTLGGPSMYIGDWWNAVYLDSIDAWFLEIIVTNDEEFWQHTVWAGYKYSGNTPAGTYTRDYGYNCCLDATFTLEACPA